MVTNDDIFQSVNNVPPVMEIETKQIPSNTRISFTVPAGKVWVLKFTSFEIASAQDIRLEFIKGAVIVRIGFLASSTNHLFESKTELRLPEGTEIGYYVPSAVTLGMGIVYEEWDAY